MNEKLFQALEAKGYISPGEMDSIRLHHQRPVSLSWDLKTVLYTGIFLLTTGLGIIIYKNIETIGHTVIVLSIAIATLACYAFCLSRAPRFSTKKVASPNLLFDYVLLTGCLLLLILLGYLQFQYELFGQRWGMATFIPMVILFASAYYFDHLGVLSMAVVNLAAWLGITVTPLQLLKQHDFSGERVIYTGILLGILLVVSAFFSKRTNIKPHFAFTYKNFGTHVLFIATLSGLFSFDDVFLWYFLLLTLVAAFQFIQAVTERSFYFLVVATLYFFVGLSYVVTDILTSLGNFDTWQLYLLLLYYLAAGLGLVFFLMRYNRILKSK